MEKREYENIGISNEIIDKGNFCLVQVGIEWSNVNKDDIQFEAILTFDKRFSSRDEAKIFIGSKIFQSVIKAVSKNNRS